MRNYAKIIALILIVAPSFVRAQGVTCADMDPICTDVGATFTANTGTTSEAGNDYGCLATQPNPSWYYFEVATNGNIDMSLTAPSDIDFIIWGPYANLAAAQADCGSLGGNEVDCSYSSTNTETPSIPAAVAGQVYIMLITNYANVTQDISLTQTGGTGSTDCSIVNNPPCFMSFMNATISAWDPTNTNGTWGANAGAVTTLPAGTYESQDPLAGLVGCTMNGDWTIIITDNLSSDNGFIFTWDITFDPAILSSSTTFTPTIISSSWVTDPTIVSGTNPVLVEPIAAGNACYIFEVVDNFGCTYDTTVCIVVNPSPVLDPAINLVGCVDVTLPVINGTDLTGNQAYFTGTNGTGTSYIAGDVV